MSSSKSLFRFAPIFQDHAVLQREQTIPVWGHGPAGDTVMVTLAGHKAETICGDAGTWHLHLPPLPAGGPHELIAESGSGRAVVRDILIGEVWLCSGQSNMDMTLANSDQDGSSPAETNLPQVRVLSVTNPATLATTLGVGGIWKPATHATLSAFSAVGGWFGRTLHRELGVPVGLICNAWGGTRIQAWTSRSALMTDPQGTEEIRTFESTVWKHQPGKRRGIPPFEQWERTEAPQDPGNAGFDRGWAAATFDDAAWPVSTLPARWNGVEQPYNGIVWFRRSVEIPSAWAGHELELKLGAIDKHDDTYVNGVRVGGLSWETPNAWCTPRVYRVPGALVKAGRLVVAVRARSHVFDAGFNGPAAHMLLELPGKPETALPLAGAWGFCVEQDWGRVVPPAIAWGPDAPNSPAILFNSRVAPLVPYGLRGVIWYQGESNAHEPAAYRRLLPLMIRDWRRAWGQGDFAFGQVQLANHHPALDIPCESPWAELREAQLAGLAEPATGLAVAVDIGEAADIHPRNKRDVGLRLARWALADIYSRGGVASGPVFTRMDNEAGGRVRCHFRNTGGGLVARGGALRRFELAGPDHTFVWAEAEIQGHSVVVWNASVPNPVAVRYAWADNPDGCNLYNNEGLPASPFRSDAFVGKPAKVD